MPDSDKPLGKYMHLKATNKPLCCQLHFLDLVAISIVFVLKVHNTILDRVDSVVCNGCLVGIPAEIFDDLIRASKGRFGIHFPFFTA